MSIRRRSGFQFSLAALMAAIVAASLLLAWIRHERNYFSQQARAVESLSLVNSYETEAGAHRWLCAVYGGCENVVGLTLIRGHYEDKDLAVLRDLPELRHLVLSEPWPFVHSFKGQITDATVEVLIGLKQLQTLNVRGTEISEAGVSRLRAALPRCEIARDES